MSQVITDFPLYHPSGRINARTIAIALLVGVPASLLFGWLFAFSHAHAQGWLAASLCTSIFCVAATVLVSVLMKQSHSRSHGFNVAAAVVFVLLIMTVRWFFLLLTQLADNGISLEFNTVNSIPWRTLWPGVWTACGWIVEAGLMFLLPIFVAKSTAADPYSESEHAWAERSFTGELFSIGGTSDTVANTLKQQGVTALLAMPRVIDIAESSLGSKWWTLKVTGSQVVADPNARWLTVAIITHDRGSDDKVTTSSETLVTSWQIATTDYDALDQHLKTISTPSSANDSAGSSVPPELQPAVVALESDNFSTAIELAKAYCQHPSNAVAADAYRLCALAQARLTKWQDSFDSYHQLFELEATAFNALQLATTAVMNSQLALGQAWFERAAEINRAKQELPTGRMHTTFLSALEQAGELTATKPHLEWLANAYRSISITDSHIVWTRGLPFFSEFLTKSLPLLRACCSEQEVRAWYETLLPDVDDEGKAALTQHLELLSRTTQ